MTYYHWLGADAETVATEQETREQLASEAFTLDSTDIDE